MFASNFSEAIEYAKDQLLRYGVEVDTGSWQGVSTEGQPSLVTQELLNLQLEVPVARRPSTMQHHELKFLQEEIMPNLPWADDHFEERVGREPTNPGEEYKNWPWWRGQEETTMERGAFSHTYQERFWPAVYHADEGTSGYRQGIRYRYGDLDDVVRLLRDNPLSRQATFPIFFPEDTGAVHGGRVPCTLHYHFLVRNGMLHMWYPIRSCDAVRHFRDDLYLACRLMLWVLKETGWDDVMPGHLYFTAYSFHVHKGDIHRLQ